MWDLIKKKIPHLLSALPIMLLIQCANTLITVHRKIRNKTTGTYMNTLLQIGPEWKDK